jgi:hypothetical protein
MILKIGGILSTRLNEGIGDLGVLGEAKIVGIFGVLEFLFVCYLCF